MKDDVLAARDAKLLDRVVQVYEKNLQSSRGAMSFLREHGLGNLETLERHQVGYSNGRLREILPRTGKVLEELREIGVLTSSSQEFFSGCLVFPISDIDGNLLTVWGCPVGDGAKHLLCLPNRTTRLWNAPVIKTYPELFLVESVLDGLSVEAAGFPNVIACLGDEGLRATDLADMEAHGVTRVVWMKSGNQKNGSMKEKSSPLFPSARSKPLSGFNPGASIHRTMMRLPGGQSPNDFLLAQGKDALIEFLQDAVHVRDGERVDTAARQTPTVQETILLHGAPSQASSFEPCPSFEPLIGTVSSFTFACGTRRYQLLGLERSARKLKVTVRVEHVGRLHVDTLDLYTARARRALGLDLCRFFGEAPEVIDSDLVKLVKRCETARMEGVAETSAPPTLLPEEREEAVAFGKRPDLIEAIIRDYETCGLVGEKANKLLLYLATVSRKMPEPLNVLILSGSGAGKTVLQDIACGFVPPEDLVKLTSLSGKALFYKDRLSLKHKVLALEEGAGAEDASYAIRSLISQGELVVEAAIKDSGTGRMTTMTNRVDGPTAVLMTTTNPHTDPETKSRFIVTSVDESREQTREILAYQRRQEGPEGLFRNVDIDGTLRRHHNFQRLLRPLAVVNPLHGQLSYVDDRLQGRRDQPKYLALIRVAAFLRQMRKTVHTREFGGETREFIEIDGEDVKFADELARAILGLTLDELSSPSRALLMELEKMVRRRSGDAQIPLLGFTRREIREYTGWSNYRVHTHLKELVDLEYVSCESDRINNTYRYRLLWNGRVGEGWLYEPGEV